MDPTPMNSATALLLDHLASLKARGRTHVSLNPSVLLRFSERLNPAGSSRGNAEAAPKSGPQVSSVPQVKAPVAARADAPALIELAAGEVESQLQQLHAILQEGLARLPSSVPRVAFSGLGPARADLLVLTDRPLAQEASLEAVAASEEGLKVVRIFQAMGLDLARVRLSALGRDLGLRGSNAVLSPEEVEFFTPHARTEIDLVRPRALLIMGRQCASALGLGAALATMRGRAHEVMGVPTVVTYSPAYLVRQEQAADGGLKVKRECWEDMLRIMEMLGLPISEKQRGFFRR